jgi:ATP-dependent DNA ligase
MSPRKTKTIPKDVVPEISAAAFPKLRLSIVPPYAPMEARSAASIPGGTEYLYEPKWDGFRCLIFRDGNKVALQSKAGQPLTRYFPELEAAVLALPAERFVLDGEIVIEFDGALDFDALLQRIHPAASRVQRLSKETPAQIYLFDMLVDAEGKDITGEPLSERKKALTRFFKRNAANRKAFRLSPTTTRPQEAKEWLQDLAGFGCDGVMAKLADEPYHSSDRDGMVKIKRLKSADCVVGGFRYASKKQSGVGSLLLGLYNADGELDHVGFTSSFAASERLALVKKLEPLHGGPGFSGKAPGGPSRWNAFNPRSSEWEPLKTKLVCEVRYDHVSGDRFRHGTKFVRWRPDKSPKQCTFEQLHPTKKKRAA